jgi:hypothetical protein
MLVSVTWSEYLIAILIASAIYYIGIAILYYKNEIFLLNFRKRDQQQPNGSSNTYTPVDELNENPQRFFQNPGQNNNAQQGKLSDQPEFITASPHVSQPELFTPHRNTSAITESADTLQQVQELTAGLKEVIAQGYDKNLIKEEFILSLQLLLKKYHFQRGFPFMGVINNLIASECEKYGYIRLSAEEQVMLWNE